MGVKGKRAGRILGWAFENGLRERVVFGKRKRVVDEGMMLWKNNGEMSRGAVLRWDKRENDLPGYQSVKGKRVVRAWVFQMERRDNESLELREKWLWEFELFAKEDEFWEHETQKKENWDELTWSSDGTIRMENKLWVFEALAIENESCTDLKAIDKGKRKWDKGKLIIRVWGFGTWNGL